MRKPDSEEMPQFHHIMMCLGAIVYALNYCSVSMTDETVDECHLLITAAKSYESCELFADTICLIDALPTKAIYANIARRTKAAKILAEASGIDIKNQVKEMGSLDSFRSVVVTLVTSAKSEEARTQIPSLCRSIGEELGVFDWSKLQFDLSHPKNLNAIKPIISAVTDDFSKLVPDESFCP